MLLRILAAIPLLAFAAFCAFGFLASYESPGSPRIRAAYAVLGTLCAIAAGWTLLVRSEEASKPS